MVLRYKLLPEYIKVVKPNLIVEVGTCRGMNAISMIEEAVKYNKVHYIGYDVFDYQDKEFHTKEHNAKPPFTFEECTKLFQKAQELWPFTYELIKGDTHKTLHGNQIKADFAFIDGGHSYETVRGDYEALKKTPLIILDDYYIADWAGNIPALEFQGVNRLTREIGGKVLPIANPVKGGGLVQLVEISSNNKSLVIK